MVAVVPSSLEGSRCTPRYFGPATSMDLERESTGTTSSPALGALCGVLGIGSLCVLLAILVFASDAARNLWEGANERTLASLTNISIRTLDADATADCTPRVQSSEFI